MLAISAIVITCRKILQLLILLSCHADIFFPVSPIVIFAHSSMIDLPPSCCACGIQAPLMCKLPPRLLSVVLKCDITPSSRYGMLSATSSRIGVVSPDDSCAADRVMRKSLLISLSHRKWRSQCLFLSGLVLFPWLEISYPSNSCGPYTTAFGVFRLMPIFDSITFSIVVASLFNWVLVNRVSANGYVITVITGITLVMYNIHPLRLLMFAGIIFLAASSVCPRR